MGGAREIASWCAHEALASVTAEPVGRAARAYVTAQNTQTAVRRIYVGAEGVRQDGRRGERMVSAGEWFHGASDRTNALAQLGIDFQALLGDLERHAISAQDAAWVITEVVPALRAWEAFVQREASSALAPWVTEWSVYEAWWDRLTRIRELARARGIILESPDPLPLPKTIWQRGAQGEGSPLDTWFGFLKTGIFAAVAVTGFVSLWAILAQFRRSRESQSGVG
jgi:hypothetical protein